MSLRCPYCGALAVQRDSSVIYGTSYGPAWLCGNYPDCDAYVGTHRDGRPLGTLADPELRAARREVHEAFDPLWQHGEMPRRDAYLWLAAQLGIPTSRCHVALFDLDQCSYAIYYVRTR